MKETTAPPPRTRYARDTERPDFTPDPAQEVAVDAFQDLHDALLDNPPKRLRKHWPAVDGLYLWGGVGRGKTYLMDCFYEGLPFSRKRRSHFHRFMQWVHQRRRAHRNRRDPLDRIAAELAHDRVLCFDEFFVSDVADAMILGRLTEALFRRGVTLVATSNVAPDELYAGGLQRDRFLPAIERLKSHCRVLHLDSENDYRLRVLERAEIFHHPLDDQAEDNLADYFRRIATERGKQDTVLAINDREIPAYRIADGILWCRFEALCEGPRGADDYTEIARCFHTVLLSGVPQLTTDDENAARRLITLVDEFYDRGVKLIVSAQCPPEALYAGKRLGFEFERTISRLHEMGTRAYLAGPHLP